MLAHEVATITINVNATHRIILTSLRFLSFKLSFGRIVSNAPIKTRPELIRFVHAGWDDGK